MWLLERQIVGSLDVMQVDPAHVTQSATAYRELLVSAGCRIIGERKSPNPKKPAVSMVFNVPSQFDREGLLQRASNLPDEIRGTVDWHLA